MKDKVTTRSTFPSARWRSISGAVAMMVGAGLLLGTTGTRWAVALTAVAGVLLLLALLWPNAYAPFARGLDKLEKGMLRGFSWLMLAGIFAVIFIPGRLLILLSGRARVRRKQIRETYWEPGGTGASRASFDRQY